MAKTANLNIRIDPETKYGAEKLFGAFGITVTDAVNIFLSQSLMVGGLPFEMRRPFHNAELEKETGGLSREITLASERSLAKDWLLPEEDEAWANL